jgi:hypothetical protein
LQDNHPEKLGRIKNNFDNKYFAGKAVGLLFNRIIDVIDSNGPETRLTGEKIENN